MGGAARIEVVAGPGTGRSLALEPGETAVVGRSPDAQLSINDRGLSRRHAALEHREDGVLVRDLGSRTGVKIDGRPIAAKGRLVATRARVDLGRTQLSIARAAAAAPPGLFLEEKIGEGDAGVVYSAWQDPPGRRVAVKAIHHAPQDKEFAARVRREAAVQMRLHHPSIVSVHGLIDHGGRFYLVRELVAGSTLEDALRRGGLAWRRAALMGAELADGLAHAHAKNVVHRDVSPRNIVLDRVSGRARLLDFGLARQVGRRSTVDGTKVTKSDEGLGSFACIAPEQFRDAKGAGPEADVYSLGAVLYHALSGVPPFRKVLPDGWMRAILAGPAPLETVAPRVPPAACALVLRAMSVEPEERPLALELARELSALGSA